MKRIHIINGHKAYPFAAGRLNAAFAERARNALEKAGYEVRLTTLEDGYEVEAEVENHVWADAVILQFPVNWMGAPWLLKKYQDEVYTAGMDGRLCNGDGRTQEAPKQNYGTGGTRSDTRYMLSVTYNAPKEAFNNPAEPFAQGLSVDDMLLPLHLNMRFFDMQALPTFSAHDVMKNPQIDSDFERFDAHIAEVFGAADQGANHVAA